MAQEFEVDLSKHTHRIRTNPKNASNKGNVHPNSLLAKAHQDPTLKKKYREWEREYLDRHRQLEWWYSAGCYAR